MPNVHSRVLTSFRKVPEVTAAFWVAKVLTTGMGEATSDFLVHQLGPLVAVLLGAFAFVVAQCRQLSIPRYDACLAGRPMTPSVPRDAGKMDASSLDLNEEQHVDAAQQDSVDAEESHAPTQGAWSARSCRPRRCPACGSILMIQNAAVTSATFRTSTGVPEPPVRSVDLEISAGAG